MKNFTFILGLFVMSAAMSAETTKTFDGVGAKVLYQALVQADLPAFEADGGYSDIINAPQNMQCSIAASGAYNDDVRRGSCSGIQGTASAIAIADALIALGINAEAGMSHVRPSASAVHCKATYINETPWNLYTCDVTADFSQE